MVWNVEHARYMIFYVVSLVLHEVIVQKSPYPPLHRAHTLRVDHSVGRLHPLLEIFYKFFTVIYFTEANFDSDFDWHRV